MSETLAPIPSQIEREKMAYDVVIIGGGVAGLAAAIRLKQLKSNLTVCIVEKGSEIGAHILSGAVFDPRALDELLPDWRAMNCPMAAAPVSKNEHWLLTERGKMGLAEFLLPPFMHNKGCYTGSLGALCRWLAEQAEAVGVDIFPGFAAAELLLDDEAGESEINSTNPSSNNKIVKGIIIGDMGVAKDGSHRSDFVAGIELHAKYTLFAEGARGHLTKQLKQIFALEADCQPQIYGLGLKELWDIDPSKHQLGRVIHTQGWPLSASKSWGGGFIYHQQGGQLALGLVVALDYKNPHLSPFMEFQRWKQHPAIAELLSGGKRVAYGARVINEGGWQSIPKLAVRGGLLIGCAAGFVNVPRIKGSHNAMKSAMLAAEAVAAALEQNLIHAELGDYQQAVNISFIADELKMVRNAQPMVAKYGNYLGTVLAGLDLWARYLKVGLPFTMKHRPDYQTLGHKDDFPKINYPKPDGILSFDRLSSVFLANINQEEDQPCHLRLRNQDIPIIVNLARYDAPETRYCPAGVYEIIGAEDEQPRLQINAQNCIHCKSCDIKDPSENINWVAPAGGGGPNYPNM